MPAMEAAFCKADRVTLTGATMPAATRSTYSSVSAFKPWPYGSISRLATGEDGLRALAEATYASAEAKEPVKVSRS